MKKGEDRQPNYQSLSDVQRALGLPEPVHPLILLINGIDKKMAGKLPSVPHRLDFYKLSFSPTLRGKVKYGQHHYDFDDGGLLFAAPNQLIGGDGNHPDDSPFFTLLIHPDFFLGYPLARKIKQYGFFSYSVHEALHLSTKEKQTIMAIFNHMEEELNSRIDEFSQDIVITQIELLLNYANRFYKRQFITRKAASHDLLQTFDELLDDYFTSEKLAAQGLPTVHYLSEQLNLTPSYLSDLLRALTGQNAQQHIQTKLIERAKERLSTTRLTISEVAYDLGFGHPQSFSKFFKAKTSLSPLVFRRSFN